MRYVQETCDDFAIARTSVIYGYNKKNFVTWIIGELEKKRQVKIVADQWVSPTLNIDLAKQVLALIEKDREGIFHTAGGERINRYDFSLKIAEVFDFDKNLITPTEMGKMKWIAKRPRDSSLNISKISEIKKPYKVEESLQLLKKEIQ